MSTSTDIAGLTPDQQSVLDQYMAVTNQDPDKAIPLLNRTQWNVQVSCRRSTIHHIGLKAV
jgi:FAS-associated factor 2